ncbi:MAG: hypothetical protein U9Q74_03775 [Gemmatimonadota bacterium]|nr:hypothetical protein [Gemmatimonadota bacterium]
MAEFHVINGIEVEVPVEIVSQGRDAVQKWYDDQKKSAARPSPASTSIARKGEE